MVLSRQYLVLRTRIRNWMGERESLLHVVRLLRCLLVQGPWQPWLVRHYRRHDTNPPLAVYPETMFAGIEPDRVALALERDAFAEGFHVPGPLVDELVAYANADGDKRIDNPHDDCVAASRIARDPRIVAAARRFLGAEPILLESKIFWTIPVADALGRVMAPAEDGLFHYDLVDIKALTVFVYLTDVDDDSNPHVVIPGTQTRRTPGQILRRSLSDGDAERRFAGRMRTITGPRGTGWFEDITTYHKQAGGGKVRLMLTLLYSLHRRPAPSRPGRAMAATGAPPASPPGVHAAA
jgi:hypothetical protein